MLGRAGAVNDDRAVRLQNFWPVLGSSAEVDLENGIDAAPPGQLGNALRQIFALIVDDVIGAGLAGERGLGLAN